MKIPLVDRNSKDGDLHYKPPSLFPIGPRFERYSGNPILKPDPNHEFESAYLYNATAIVVDDKVFLLYRAQNKARESSIGLAWSDDGFHFVRYGQPVIYATEPWEMGGGCEDPRIVRDAETKLFVVTYSAYDKVTSRLCVATSPNLLQWTKYPPFISPDSLWSDIAKTDDGREIIRQGWLKSGAIFTERHRDGKYYMLWGESSFYWANSTDLVRWELNSQSYINNIFASGIWPWQDKLIEPGPAPIKVEYKDSTKNHYILFYNSSTTGGGQYSKGTYAISQMLVDYDDLSAPVARLERPILVPESDNEKKGQVDKVVFTEGIVQFHGQWFMYFGQGDSELGVATAPVC